MRLWPRTMHLGAESARMASQPKPSKDDAMFANSKDHPLELPAGRGQGGEYARTGSLPVLACHLYHEILEIPDMATASLSSLPAMPRARRQM
jgi:hypothetical protein